MNFKIINEQTYKRLDCDIVSEDSCAASNHSFAKIEVCGSVFKIAWASDSELIRPQFLRLSPNIYAIGIDQNFLIYNFNKKYKIMSLEFMCYFYETKRYDKYLFVATEIEVIIIDIELNKVIGKIPLPNIYANLLINKNNIEINCLDNTHLSFNFHDIIKCYK